MHIILLSLFSLENIKYNSSSLKHSSLKHDFRYNTGHCWTPTDFAITLVITGLDTLANTKIGFDPNNSVIKRLWCTSSF